MEKMIVMGNLGCRDRGIDEPRTLTGSVPSSVSLVLTNRSGELTILGLLETPRLVVTRGEEDDFMPTIFQCNCRIHHQSLGTAWYVSFNSFSNRSSSPIPRSGCTKAIRSFLLSCTCDMGLYVHSSRFIRAAERHGPWSLHIL